MVGGAGGKGVWGTPGEVYDVEEVDVRDPNYDEDQVSEHQINFCSASLIVKKSILQIIVLPIVLQPFLFSNGE